MSRISGIIAFQTKKLNLEYDLGKEIPHTLFESISLSIIPESFKAIA